MKKAIAVVLSILAATGVAAMVFYYIRAYRAEQQYVHRNSAAILALAVDDLLIDNLGSVVSARSDKKSGKDSTTTVFLQHILQAGLDIPARIYFYSLAEDPSTFYTLQKINDRAKWRNFLRKYTLGMEAPQEGAKTQLTKNIALLKSGDRLLFRLSLKDSLSSSFSAEALQQDDNWLQIRQLNAMKKLPKLDHLSYWTLDKTISLQAHIHQEKTVVQGTWQTEKILPKGIQEARAIRQDDVALLFYSQLPISSTPYIAEVLSKFSDVVAEDLANEQPRYMDLLIRQQTVFQQDTIITYDYDENFNSVETHAIQHVEVPLIESVWQGDGAFAQQLPNKMFYNFNKHVVGRHILLSTGTNSLKDLKFEKKNALLTLMMDFNHWPNAWLIEPLKTLQQKGLKLSLKGTSKGERIMQIDGELRYKPLLQE